LSEQDEIEAFTASLVVSRETRTRFEAYAALLKHWQSRINLISAHTLIDLWKRHMLDCAQLMPLLPSDYAALYDVGSGAGFPGLVLALLGAPNVHLIERSPRKAAFLQEAARVTGCAVTIHACTVAALAARGPLVPGRRVITARAVAPLGRLLALVEPLVDRDTCCIMMKGEGVDSELTLARQHWRFALERFASKTEPKAAILRLEQVRHGHD
jgi:16S rRNA (guanine527-N7)-methyltransferase